MFSVTLNNLCIHFKTPEEEKIFVLFETYNRFIYVYTAMYCSVYKKSE